jgi:tetratricopeptide (TPR) repeat protein
MTFLKKLHPALTLTIVFILAAAMRLLVLYQISSDPRLDQVGGDGFAYLKWANIIIQGDWIGHEVFYPSPLYPYLLAVFLKVMGMHLITLMTLQALVGAAGCAILAIATHKLFGPPAGLLAGLMATFYPALISYDLQIDKTFLDPPLVAATLFFIAGVIQRPKWTAWFFCGVVIGIFSLTRENSLALIPPIMLWGWFYFRSERSKQRAIWMGAFLGGIGLIVLPVCLRNSLIGGEFHLSTAKFGANFYYGNAAKADGIYFPLRPGHGDLRYEQIDATEIAEEAMGRELPISEVSSYWTHLTLNEMASDPMRWVKLSIRKFVMFWCDTEIADADIHDRHVVFSPVLRMLDNVWGFGVVFSIAMAGAVILWSRFRGQVVILLLLAVTYAIAIAAFILFGRYRLPAVPLLMPLAAAGIAHVFYTNRLTRICALFALVLAIILVDLGDTAIPERIRGANPYNRGNVFASVGKTDLAISEYRQAIRQNPKLEQAYSSLSLQLSNRGDLQEAEQLASKAIDLNANNASAHANLGVALAKSGKVDQAIVEFQTARDLQPENHAIRFDLASALLQLNRTDDAKPLLNDLATTQPADEFTQRATELLKNLPRTQ